MLLIRARRQAFLRAFRQTAMILAGDSNMALSARNQLIGKVKEIKVGDIMAHVTVKVGSNLIESIVTSNSAEELNLKKGDTVRVVIKSTEVMIQKD
jgi:molybdopterin-binding protein